MRGAGDRRRDLTFHAIVPVVGTRERAADQTLLYPRRALGEFAVGGEAGELRARAGAAGRAVVGFAGAKDEVAAVNADGWRRGEQLHVVDLGVALGVDGLAHAPRKIG